MQHEITYRRNSLAILRFFLYFPPLRGGNKREGDEFNDFPMIIHPHLSPPPSRGRNFRMAYLLRIVHHIRF